MVPCGGSVSDAPVVSAVNTCSRNVSKAMAAACPTRSSALIWYSRAISPMTQAMLPKLTATAFGSPVEPEV